CPALSEGYSGLVMKCMQKRREDRPQDPEALIHDLERLLNGEPLTASTAHRQASPVQRPVTHHGHRPPTSVIIPPRKQSSPAGLIAMVVIGVIAIAGAIIFFSGTSDNGQVVRPPTPPQPKQVIVNGPPGLDPEERAKKDVQRFRELVDPQFGNASKADRFTEPYATIQRMIDKSKASADFAAQKAWQDEQGAYAKRVNAIIQSQYWAPIKAKAEEAFNASRYQHALEE